MSSQRDRCVLYNELDVQSVDQLKEFLQLSSLKEKKKNLNGMEGTS